MSQTAPRFDLHVHSFRSRLCDPDGISIKAALDGIVRDPRTVFIDDSAKYIRQISFSQERIAKGEEEKTVLTFTEVDEDE